MAFESIAFRGKETGDLWVTPSAADFRCSSGMTTKHTLLFPQTRTIKQPLFFAQDFFAQDFYAQDFFAQDEADLPNDSRQEPAYFEAEVRKRGKAGMALSAYSRNATYLASLAFSFFLNILPLKPVSTATDLLSRLAAFSFCSSR